MIEISPVVLEKKNENVKSLRDRKMDAGQIVIKKADLSLPLRWAKNDTNASQK